MMKVKHDPSADSQSSLWLNRKSVIERPRLAVPAVDFITAWPYQRCGDIGYGSSAEMQENEFHQEFCKMEIRLTLGRKNLLRDFSSWERKCLANGQLTCFFKEIKPTISLKNISLISILQKFTFMTIMAYE